MKLSNNELITKKKLAISNKVIGKPLNIGTGFQALSFKHDQFKGLMDPIVMVDHYTMTLPTFGEHPHAGMSAVTILFEDSDGVFNNRDSLGNDIDLMPGDSYWLKAGSGATHDEKPTSGSRAHGLQIFVNLPQSLENETPNSLHLPAANMPVIKGEDHKVRVVYGESNNTQGAISPTLPFTALDAYLEEGGSFTHEISGDQSVFVYSVCGEMNITIDNQTILLPDGQAIVFQNQSGACCLTLTSSNRAHAIVLQGAPIREKFVQRGPFVMSSILELDRVSAAYQAGKFDAIPTAS